MPQSVILSRPTTAHLALYRGDSGAFRVSVTDAAGAPLDVSDASWLCQIRPGPDAPPWITLPVAAVEDDPSSVDVSVSPEASEAITAHGVWDLQMTLDGRTITLLAGAVQITRDVSRAEAAD